jgi:hypothetical protein
LSKKISMTRLFPFPSWHEDWTGDGVVAAGVALAGVLEVSAATEANTTELVATRTDEAAFAAHRYLIVAPSCQQNI